MAEQTFPKQLAMPGGYSGYAPNQRRCAVRSPPIAMPSTASESALLVLSCHEEHQRAPRLMMVWANHLYD